MATPLVMNGAPRRTGVFAVWSGERAGPCGPRGLFGQLTQGFSPGLTFGDAPPALGGRGLSHDLHQRAALYAEEHDLNLNAVVQVALKECLAPAE